MTVCDDVDLILAVGAASGGFTQDDLATVRDHLEACPRCTRAAADYAATADLLAIAAEPVSPPEALRSRIMAEVYASLPATTPPRRTPRSAWLSSAWRRIPSGRAFTLGGALAAAAAVALLVVALGRGGAGPVSSPVHAALGQPAVQGALTWYPQTQTSVLTVRGLAPHDPQVYEVWLVRSSNAPTGVGFLTEQPDGSWTLAVHGSIAGYAQVAATVEPRGGSRKPTSAPVLVGALPAT